MNNDWADDFDKVIKAGSLESYILSCYSKDGVDKALAPDNPDNGLFTSRSDRIDDFFNHFDDEIKRYATREDVINAYPEMTPKDEEHEDGIKIGQFNFAVVEIIKRLMQRYESIFTANPKKTFSELVDLDDATILKSLTNSKIVRQKSFRGLIEENYPAKLIIGLAGKKTGPFITNEAADLLMAKFSREILYIYPENVDYNARVRRAIMYTVQEIYSEHKIVLEENPGKTLTQILKQKNLERQ